MANKRFYFLGAMGIVFAGIMFLLGFKMGKNKNYMQFLGLRFGSLVMGVSSLDAIQSGDIDSVESKIRLQCYIDAIILLENEHWENDSLLSIYTGDLWETKQKNNSINASATEKRFDQIMRQKLKIK